MKQCISMVTYSLKINGVPSGSITSTRGLRQGNHLSPYLFLIYAEGLSALIKKSVENRVLHVVAACKRGLNIFHLFFANDSLIFCKASKEESESLQRIIGIYERASVQLLNRAKTSLFFSKNTPTDIKEEFKRRFDAQVIRQHEKYLGLPSLVGRSKRNTWNLKRS